ncbi:hypothetical protein [Sphingobacterium mizutaii]|uniref:hypothetical protein n=1 Tax=Sphingobacterium mizutaii TaxID=1010 RepID=UPI001626BCD2|nr:hypothetical protein [Sphingobacterium mizutaii]
MIVKLNKNQFDYLSYSLSEEQEELKLKLRQVRKENNLAFIDIDDDTAIDIRDWAMEKQVRVGFDINYELNPEGKILEELIDLFYVE